MQRGVGAIRTGCENPHQYPRDVALWLLAQLPYTSPLLEDDLLITLTPDRETDTHTYPHSDSRARKIMYELMEHRQREGIHSSLSQREFGRIFNRALSTHQRELMRPPEDTAIVTDLLSFTQPEIVEMARYYASRGWG